MRILLVGEFSRLHNSLKEGLQALGHEVKIIGSGDYFKNYPVDFYIKRRFDNGFWRKLKVGIYRVFKIDITSLNVLQQFFSYKEILKHQDIVQLINESSLGIQAKEERKAIQFLSRYNKNIFLLSCGTDHINVSFAMEKKIRYSIFTPLLEKRISEKNYSGSLRYLRSEYKELHDFLYQKVIHGVIASDMDYHLPLENHPKYLGLLPNPINTDKLKYQEIEINDKIIIFLGINRSNSIKKGVDFFQKALHIIHKKYTDKIEIIKVENLPYDTYIKKYDSAHILLDQIYSFDQGYNALEAMAKGKVVFTGAEKELLEKYDLEEDQICINALADVDYLVNKLSWLIENPDKIKKIGKNARRFIEEKHNYKKVAQLYLDAWKNAMN